MRALAGTGTLLRLLVRRDRLVLPMWVLPLAALPVFYAATIESLYPTATARRALAAGAAANPAELATLGPVFGSSLGGLTAWRAGPALALVGLAAALTVIRHTRAEEEAGRRELLGAGAVGRPAGLSAALALAFGGSLAVGTIVTAGLLARGLPVAGSVALGSCVTLAGWLFAGVAAVAAQLTASARAARGLAGAVLGLAYLLRAAGDAGGSGWLSAASPLGWLGRVRPYATERWSLLALAVAVALSTAALAYMMASRRDLGAGLLPARPGRAEAGAGLGSPLGLAWRLQRATLLGWVIAFAVTGAVIGGAASGVPGQLGTSPQLRDALTRLGGSGRLADAYLAAALGILGPVAAAYSISATGRLRTEETSHRAEPVLATAVSRLAWATSHFTFAVVGPVVILAAAGASAGLAGGGAVPRLVAAALVQLPAVWVLAAVTMALYGLLPRLTAASWAALAACLLVAEVGVLLRVNQAVLDLSPFTSLPRLPGGPVSPLPLLVLTSVSIVVAAAGMAGFRRRPVG